MNACRREMRRRLVSEAVMVAPARADLVIGRELHGAAAGCCELVDIFGSGWEGAFGDMDFVVVEIGDDACGEMNHLVDGAPDSAGGEDARVAGDAGIRGIDAA